MSEGLTFRGDAPPVANFRDLLEAAPDAMVGVDPAGLIHSVNRHAESLFGYPRGALVGVDIETLVPEWFRTAHRAHQGGRSAHARTRPMGAGLLLTGRRRDGTQFPVDISLSHIGAGDDLLVIAAVRDLTARNEAEEARRQGDRMSAMIEFSGEAIINTTLSGAITSWNRTAERMFGYTNQEAVGKPIDLLSPEDRTGETRAILDRFRAGEPGEPGERFETIRARKDGTVFPAFVSVSPICDAVGAIVGASTVTADATEATQAAQDARSLAAAEELIRTVMASASIGIALADLDGSFRVVNRSLCELLGYDEAWLLAHRVRDIVHPDDVEGLLLARVVDGSSDAGATIVRLVRADGATVWVRRVSVLIRDGDGEPNLLMVQLEDITAEHEAQEALVHQALHDPLTGLHNRAWLLDILAIDLHAAKRLGQSLGALFVDLDHFKVVNDSLGHTAGDEVLATVANRIVAALRPGDRVGRFGGDEFVIVVQDVRDVEAKRCAERVSASIATDLQVRGHRIVPTASIGIATSTSTSTADSLLRDANAALSHAKATRRASWHIFDEEIRTKALGRLTVEEELREAITASQFVVYYQPIVALADARVVGHEALVRWVHPTRGLLSPLDFLEVAEATGLITAIGDQVLDQVSAMLAARPDLPGPISVNVSAVQVAAPGWLSGVRDTLAAHRVDPDRIVIEVTEAAILSLMDSARHALASLRGLGVGIHLDDFGTGYSSISVLRDLPVTGVKLGQRFVHGLTAGDSKANILAKGVSSLVEGMHLTGIAEGIETPMQAGILRTQGWECGQGYYFGKPAAVPFTR